MNFYLDIVSLIKSVTFSYVVFSNRRGRRGGAENAEKRLSLYPLRLLCVLCGLKSKQTFLEFT